MTENLNAWMRAIALTGGVWLVGLLFTRLLLKWLIRWSRRTSLELDDIILKSFRPHIPIWFLAVGVTIGVRYAPLAPGSVQVVDQVMRGILAISIALGSASLVVGLLEGRLYPGASTLPQAPVNTLIRRIVYLVFLAVAAMMILAGLGISITPLLTALGVGSLAIALALQPTLSNLFAGVQLLLARQIRVGDVIELEGGQQGVVADITMRATLVREMPDNTFVVPNSKLIEMVVRNYGLPSADHNLPINFGVSYRSDLDRVREVAAEAAAGTQRSRGGPVSDFAPVVTVRSFGASAIDLVAVLRVPHFTERGPMTDDFLRRIHRRFREEGIEIPYPQLVVHMPAKDPEPGEAANPST
jgi:small-conductance mechanosensitive channel